MIPRPSWRRLEPTPRSGCGYDEQMCRHRADERAQRSEVRQPADAESVSVTRHASGPPFASDRRVDQRSRNRHSCRRVCDRCCGRRQPPPRSIVPGRHSCRCRVSKEHECRYSSRSTASCVAAARRRESSRTAYSGRSRRHRQSACRAAAFASYGLQARRWRLTPFRLAAAKSRAST